MPLSVGIEIAIVGTNVDNLLNVWGVVRSALFPQVPDPSSPVYAEQLALRAKAMAAQTANGITRGTITRPSYRVERDSKTGSKILYAEGTFDLLLLINT
jgi:hypothetical protein